MAPSAACSRSPACRRAAPRRRPAVVTRRGARPGLARPRLDGRRVGIELPVLREHLLRVGESGGWRISSISSLGSAIPLGARGLRPDRLELARLELAGDLALDLRLVGRRLARRLARRDWNWRKRFSFRISSTSTRYTLAATRHEREADASRGSSRRRSGRGRPSTARSAARAPAARARSSIRTGRATVRRCEKPMFAKRWWKCQLSAM